MGFVRTELLLMIACLKELPSHVPLRAKSTSKMELRTMIPAINHPDHGGRGKLRTEKRMARHHAQ